jgi:acetoin utilization deacetylase AcuC-like enzyme
MTLLYYDDRFLAHITGAHPERPVRLTQIMSHLERQGMVAQCRRPEWTPASHERLMRVHEAGYLEHLHEFVTSGGGRIEGDTVVSRASYDVARLAAGAAADALDRVVRGEAKNALCLVRPPGHHARGHEAMGFCLLNNIAIAARVATDEHKLDRALIVDWDVHHGNGTQDAFWTDGRVGFLSIHRWPFYPGTGDSDETGSGAGLGTTLNLPVEFGTSRQEYLARFRTALENFADRLRPQIVLISAGFDSHRDDPIGSLELETEDFTQLSRMVIDVANIHAAGRIVSILEGGYNPGVLAGCVEVHLHELLEADSKSTASLGSVGA